MDALGIDAGILAEGVHEPVQEAQVVDPLGRCRSAAEAGVPGATERLRVGHGESPASGGPVELGDLGHASGVASGVVERHHQGCGLRGGRGHDQAVGALLRPDGELTDDIDGTRDRRPAGVRGGRSVPGAGRQGQHQGQEGDPDRAGPPRHRAWSDRGTSSWARAWLLRRIRPGP